MQRCQGHPITRAMDALSPVWASETTSSTPLRPRATRARRRFAPERFGLGGADGQVDHLAMAILVHPVGDHEGLAAHASVGVAHLLDLGVEPEVGVAGLQGVLAKGPDPLI